MASADVEYRCFVGGLAWATDAVSLVKAFGVYGSIPECKIIIDRETGRSRGFGFVTFLSEQVMREAIEGMNGQELDGRNITVNEAQSRDSGGGGGGCLEDGGGGGYSRGGGGGDRGYGGGDSDEIKEIEEEEVPREEGRITAPFEINEIEEEEEVPREEGRITAPFGTEEVLREERRTTALSGIEEQPVEERRSTAPSGSVLVTQWLWRGACFLSCTYLTSVYGLIVIDFLQRSVHESVDGEDFHSSTSLAAFVLMSFFGGVTLYTGVYSIFESESVRHTVQVYESVICILKHAFDLSAAVSVTFLGIQYPHTLQGGWHARVIGLSVGVYLLVSTHLWVRFDPRRDEHKPISLHDKEKQKQPAPPRAFSRPNNREPSQLHFGDKQVDHEPASPENHSRGKVSERPHFRIPHLDAVPMAVENKCLRSYKVLEPSFSLMKLMCQCFLDLATESTKSKGESFHLTADLNFLKISSLRNAGTKGDHQEIFECQKVCQLIVLSLHSSTR
ncbi:hypothetical protein IFM89_023959 [Coptis chinensis]|uniref:RRM domain-containing protein n=1 Tax=Coptis chinensis TaxID=261450 RepID=A0A835HJI8_9MAGN|nr:hypothetical protein IFM89_023959 [Coptis chinensis]